METFRRTENLNFGALGATLLLVFALTACAESPGLGFSSQQLSDGTFKVLYVGRAGATFDAAHHALRDNAQNLCKGQYELEILSDTMPNFDAPRTAGFGAQGLVRCVH